MRLISIMAMAAVEAVSKAVRIVMVPAGAAADMVRMELRQSQGQLSEVGPAAGWKPNESPAASTPKAA